MKTERTLLLIEVEFSLQSVINQLLLNAFYYQNCWRREYRNARKAQYNLFTIADFHFVLAVAIRIA